MNGIEIQCLEIPTQPGSRPKTWWNVYSANTPNFLDFNDYNTLQDLLTTIPYRTEDNGIGQASIAFECANCKSTDHPVSVCPFYEIAGWLGPSREDDAPRNPPSNDPNALRRNNNGNGNGNSHNNRGRQNNQRGRGQGQEFNGRNNNRRGRY